MKLTNQPFFFVWVFIALVSADSALGQTNDWVRARNGVIPGDAVEAGYEDDGRKTYVCRAQSGGNYVSGKALDDRCYYNSGSRERSVSRFEILVGSGFTWRRTTSRDRAIVVGSNGDENFYVCRVSDSGGLYSGSLQEGRCYYTRNNRGYSRRSFEILESSQRSNTLLSAASRGDYQSVRDALRDGQAVDQKDSNGKTALMLASEQGYSNVVRELLYERASIEIRDPKGNTALMLAARNGRPLIVDQLSRAGADVGARNRAGDTAFTLAASGGHARLVRSLIRGDDRIDTVDIGWAFRNAAFYGHPDVLELLLESGASIESPDLNGQTALMSASRGKQRDTIRFLLRNDASINARDVNGNSPFIYGVNSDSEKVLAVFMEERGFVKSADPDAEMGLRIAAKNNRRKSAAYLLKQGVDVNAPSSKDGSTALMWSAREGHEKLTKTLIKSGANIDKQNNLGETALMLAAANSKKNTLKVLIRSGANLNLRDASGVTALGWAVRNKHKDTRKELKKAKAIE